MVGRGWSPLGIGIAAYLVFVGGGLWLLDVTECYGENDGATGCTVLEFLSLPGALVGLGVCLGWLPDQLKRRWP